MILVSVPQEQTLVLLHNAIIIKLEVYKNVMSTYDYEGLTCSPELNLNGWS